MSLPEDIIGISECFVEHFKKSFHGYENEPTLTWINRINDNSCHVHLCIENNNIYNVSVTKSPYMLNGVIFRISEAYFNSKSHEVSASLEETEFIKKIKCVIRILKKLNLAVNKLKYDSNNIKSLIQSYIQKKYNFEPKLIYKYEFDIRFENISYYTKKTRKAKSRRFDVLKDSEFVYNIDVILKTDFNSIFLDFTFKKQQLFLIEYKEYYHNKDISKIIRSEKLLNIMQNAEC